MTADTGTMDLSRVEAERRRLAGEPELDGAAEVTERIVADVLAGGEGLDEVEVPDDPSALFDAERPVRLDDDASPSDWARRIVAEVLDRHVEPERPAAPAGASAAAPAGGEVDARPELADGHRAYYALLAGDSPLALLPGDVVDPDGRPWAPERDPELEAAVSRIVESFELTPVVATDEDDASWDDVGLSDAVALPSIGQSTGRTIAWVVLALIWIGAAAALVPFAFEGTEAAVDFTFDIWGQP